MFMEVFHMKIAVAASNGKASRAVISELIARGHEVTAFARSENKSAAKDFVQKDILDLTKGSIVELDKLAGEPVDIMVNGKYLAKGEVVVIDENFGVRITEIVSPLERAARLQ